ncbi:MAG: DUF4215 domain-containing protein [Candidatus Pacearchaeota archaeon]|nr:DUF4215 domain-containing protein [Candidatus Pacearchaeota archaeon]
MKKTLSLFALAIMLVLTLGFVSACHCGDGIITTRHPYHEECDDHNILNNDGCSSTCTAESCGDGIIQSSEQCDDGNTADGDGCTANCTTEVPTVPEFGPIIGVLTALGALGVFFVVRRN